VLTALYPGKGFADRTSSDQAVATADPGLYLTALVLLAISHPLWLVLLHTQAGIGGSGAVVVTEALLLAACVPLLLKRLPLGFYLAGVLLLINAVALGLLRDSTDPKPLRDLLVPLVFLGVGASIANEAVADRVLKTAVWLVLAVGFFEFLALDAFMRVFDIQSYFLARGVGDPNIGLYRQDKLVASALRPDGIGRTILPFLGPHRASSVFVEPVSFGNFAVICAAWGLAKGREAWRSGAFFVAAALVMLVLCDSRFGLLSIAVLALLRLVVVRGGEPIGIAFPFACVGILIGMAAVLGVEYTDSVLGRLTLTGDTLRSMPGGGLFGVAASARRYYDMGYPYALANFGLVACLAIWAAFWLLPRQFPVAQRFHLYVALYLALLLCVSGDSAFAFKTSAVLWFLLGMLTGDRTSAVSAPE
jgi:putative polymerase